MDRLRCSSRRRIPRRRAEWPREFEKGHCRISRQMHLRLPQQLVLGGPDTQALVKLEMLREWRGKGRGARGGVPFFLKYGCGPPQNHVVPTPPCGCLLVMV